MSMKDCNGQISPEGPNQLLNQQHLTVQPPQYPHSESPDYHTDLLHIANKHNILLFAFSLQAWSEQPPPHHNPTSLLHCVSPSHIQPQPGPEESLTLLRALISPEKVEELGDGETQKVAQEPFSPHIIASDASVEETFLTPPSSTAAEENLSEPELFINHQPSSQLESPYRQSDDPFLYSPNHCFDSPRNPWNESTVEKLLEEEQKWHINWDESLPVLQHPSHDEMLQDWFGSNIAEYKFV
ncbi:uncharacterized protein UTRI_10245 [Ustilago trichophora]|uniref:Uncharacterized protein n=1 Tax=Ustilago trichophora TaxID=86804 RepID=A0A5C3EKN0_9BASI|nr:uncharacterized protein UTRI_10245 [Ustilago trichophora]